MLNAIIRFSLVYRTFVVVGAALLLILGSVVASRTPVDVLPDLTAPTVTVITEAPGLAPEEVETLVTFPLESALNGAPDVRRLRSISGAGVSFIWVEFEWGQEVYLSRQIVSERLQEVRLPEDARAPRLGPLSSIMGEITFIALTSETLSEKELRLVAETDVRRALLSISGIAQVIPIGGEKRQYQVELDAVALAQHAVTPDEVATALRSGSSSAAAGFHAEAGQEYVVRGLGRVRGTRDLAATVIKVVDGIPLTVADLATVHDGAEPRRGTAAYSTRPAVILSVLKQPGANTLELTRQIDRTMEELSQELPEGVVVEKENFRQADFIEVAIRNVSHALRDGALLVVLMLFLFLGNLRSTLIAAVAIPLSLVSGALVISAFGATVNTMTLGGLTIAIGALVDDAIITVENVFRTLRLEREVSDDEQRPDLEVVYSATVEVVGPIVYATLIICLVFVPLFVLPGMEGRLMHPLGLAYVSALATSLLVSLTLTPALCSFLLPRSGVLTRRTPWLLRGLLSAYQPTVAWAIRRPRAVLVAAVTAVVAALAVVPLLGRSFLPAFNEGALTVAVASAPGITLEESDALGREVEATLLSFPEVVSTSRRTGRAERDEHLQGVNGAEIEVVLQTGRDKSVFLPEMRRAVATIPGVSVTFGQPISHRIDHMISGSKANLAVKLFGPDLTVLRRLAASAERVLSEVPGIVDLSNQEQSSVPQIVIDFDRDAMALHGLSAEALALAVEALFQGAQVGEVLEDGIVTDVVIRFPERLRQSRDDLLALPVATAGGRAIRLADVAEVRFDMGPSIVRRENVHRTAVLTANIAGQDLTGTVERARAALEEALDLPPGYRLAYGGQFEAATESLRTIGVLSALVILAMYGLLFFAYSNHRHALIVMVNLPLAAIGGVFAIALGDGVLSVASLLGFITLFGIATRNGVLLVSRYEQLMAKEGLTVHEAVVRGSLERMSPVLMTALAAGLALVPLIIAGGRPGNEILSPMGQVILGGLLTSTALNLVVVPTLFVAWGRSDVRAQLRPAEPGESMGRRSASVERG